MVLASPPPATAAQSHYTTLEAAELLGLAVRSVQLMVDRGELQAWKTPGGHRRISRESVELWQRSNGTQRPGRAPAPAAGEGAAGPPRVLLIEDSVHFQNLIALLVRQHLPDVALRVAPDGIVGLATVGQWQPDVLIVDILLPGIDGATLITSLRTHPQFAAQKLVVVTSLDEAERAPYAFALTGLPVVHKPALVAELPGLLARLVAGVRPAQAA